MLYNLHAELQILLCIFFCFQEPIRFNERETREEVFGCKELDTKENVLQLL